MERETTTTSDADRAPFMPADDAPRARWMPRLWRRVCAFLGIAAAALTVAGLVSLKDSLAAQWRAAAGDFRWVVLVTGDAVDVDEVGRFLKELDSVGSVTLTPASAILDELRNEPMLAGQMSALDPSALPSAWQVAWSPDMDAAQLSSDLDDLRRLPAVVDVAYDRRDLEKIAAYRNAWLKVRVLLSALLVIGATLFAVLLGRFLFFTNLRAIRLPAFAAFTLGAVLAWIAGLAIGWWLVGPFDPRLAWGALAAAIARLAWGRVREAE